LFLLNRETIQCDSDNRFFSLNIRKVKRYIYLKMKMQIKLGPILSQAIKLQVLSTPFPFISFNARGHRFQILKSKFSEYPESSRLGFDCLFIKPNGYKLDVILFNLNQVSTL